MTRAICLVTVVCCCLPSVSAFAEDASLEILTGGATKKDKLPLIVALHGRGGAPSEIIHLLDGFSVKARVIAPHGATRVGEGWGWFESSWKAMPDEMAPGIKAAADLVAKLIADKTRTSATCGKAIVVGFSQGGFLAYALAAREPAIIGAALPISGYLPMTLTPSSLRRDRPGRVTAYHGDADEVIKLDYDRTTHERFVAAGFGGELQVYPGVKHQVTPQMVKDIHAQLAREIKDAGCAR